MIGRSAPVLVLHSKHVERRFIQPVGGVDRVSTAIFGQQIEEGVVHPGDGLQANAGKVAGRH